MKRMILTAVLTAGIGALLFAGNASGDNYGGVSATTRAQVQAEVRKQFPASEWRWAWCVINRESGYNPRAVNWHDAHGGSHGLFQVNGTHAYTFRALWHKRYTIQGGVRMAYLLWRGSGRSPWYGGSSSC